MNKSQADAVIDAGVKFVVSPGFDVGVAEICVAR